MSRTTSSQHDSFIKTVGLNIKRYRQERRLTQLELAKHLGLSSIAICNFERGIISPSLRTIYEMSVYFNIPAAKLLADQDMIVFNKNFFLTQLTGDK